MEKKEIFDLLIKNLDGAGVFLNVKDGMGNVNTMTIGWGSVGKIWGRDMFTVLVRYSRHTYSLLKNAKDFSINIPKVSSMNKELGFCGSKSGRDFDKFKECNFTLKSAKKIDTPIIEECEAFYECKICYRQAMNPMSIIDKDGIEDRYYKDNDYHEMFIGEILEQY